MQTIARATYNPPLLIVAGAKGAVGSTVAAAIGALKKDPRAVLPFLTTRGDCKEDWDAIDFPRIFKIILQSGYSGDLSLELYTYANRPVEAGQESLSYLLPQFREAGFDVDALLGPSRIGNEN